MEDFLYKYTRVYTQTYKKRCTYIYNQIKTNNLKLRISAHIVMPAPRMHPLVLCRKTLNSSFSFTENVYSESMLRFKFKQFSLTESYHFYLSKRTSRFAWKHHSDFRVYLVIKKI